MGGGGVVSRVWVGGRQAGEDRLCWTQGKNNGHDNRRSRRSDLGHLAHRWLYEFKIHNKVINSNIHLVLDGFR